LCFLRTIFLRAALSSHPVAAASLLPAGTAVVVQLQVDEEREFSLTFPSGYPSVAELYAELQRASGRSLPDRMKLYFRVPSGAHIGVSSSAASLDWNLYHQPKPYTYVARIATRTPPSSPERPAGVAATGDAAGPTKKQSSVADLSAMLEKVRLADDGMLIISYLQQIINTNKKSKT
jgi:hypothetical protein